MLVLRIVVVLLLIWVFGCNFGSSGTFDDDPRAWTWAFGEPKPSPGITVNKSRYWSSSHLTAEYIWHFDLTLSHDAIAELVSNPNVEQLDAPPDVDDAVMDRPSWFLPDGPEGYTGYEVSGANSFVIYLDRETGRSYWSAWQL